LPTLVDRSRRRESIATFPTILGNPSQRQQIARLSRQVWVCATSANRYHSTNSKDRYYLDHPSVFAAKIAVCRVQFDGEADASNLPHVVRRLSANKLIGAEPMDHCATRGAEWWADFVDGNLRIGVHRAVADAQRLRQRRRR
jgi:hypothetical protein